MNMRMLHEAEAQMARAEGLRQAMDRVTNPQARAVLTAQFEAAFALGRQMVLDARDADED
jgi:hypothetical protein